MNNDLYFLKEARVYSMYGITLDQFLALDPTKQEILIEKYCMLKSKENNLAQLKEKETIKTKILKMIKK